MIALKYARKETDFFEIWWFYDVMTHTGESIPPKGNEKKNDRKYLNMDTYKLYKMLSRSLRGSCQVAMSGDLAFRVPCVYYSPSLPVCTTYSIEAHQEEERLDTRHHSPVITAIPNRSR